MGGWVDLFFTFMRYLRAFSPFRFLFSRLALNRQAITTVAPLRVVVCCCWDTVEGGDGGWLECGYID